LHQVDLDVEYPIRSWWVLCHENVERDVVHGDPGRGLSFSRTMVCVSMENEVGAVAVHHLCES